MQYPRLFFSLSQEEKDMYDRLAIENGMKTPAFIKMLCKKGLDQWLHMGNS